MVGCRGGEAALPAPWLEPTTTRAAELEGRRVAPALLMAIYDAFGRAEEAEVYDTLATVAAGETLDLERRRSRVAGSTPRTRPSTRCG